MQRNIYIDIQAAVIFIVNLPFFRLSVSITERNSFIILSSLRGGQISSILEKKSNQFFIEFSDVKLRNLKSSSIKVCAVGCFKTGH